MRRRDEGPGNRRLRLHRLARRRRAARRRPRAARTSTCARRPTTTRPRSDRDRRPRRPEALAAALDGCDAVIHLAAAPTSARSSTTRSAPSSVERARHARRAGGGARTRASGASSTARTIWVYGDVAATSRRRGHAARPARATSTPRRKLAGEMYCTLLRASCTALDRTILRFGIPYGPRARPAAVIPAFVAQGARRRAADDRRRRQPDAPLRLRRGPRRRRRPGAGAGRGEPCLQPRRRPRP